MHTLQVCAQVKDDAHAVAHVSGLSVESFSLCSMVSLFCDTKIPNDLLILIICKRKKKSSHKQTLELVFHTNVAFGYKILLKFFVSIKKYIY